MRSLNSPNTPHPSQTVFSTSLSLILLLAGATWVSTNVIAPASVYAEPTRVDITLDPLPNETFELLLRRAEAIARAATQRSFDRDILINEVNVVIAARNQDNLAPILNLKVTRTNWRDRPDPKIWSTYYRTSKSLLNLEPAKPR